MNQAVQHTRMSDPSASPKLIKLCSISGERYRIVPIYKLIVPFAVSLLFSYLSNLHFFLSFLFICESESEICQNDLEINNSFDNLYFHSLTFPVIAFLTRILRELISQWAILQMGSIIIDWMIN